MGEAIEPRSKQGAGRRRRQEIAPRLGQAKRKAAAVVGILGALDEASPNQRIDRTADRRRAAPYSSRDSTNGKVLEPDTILLHKGDVVWVSNANQSERRRFSSPFGPTMP